MTRHFGLGLAALLFCAGSAAAASTRDADPAAESVIAAWPGGSRAAAKAMIARYGEPSRFSEGALVWLGNGPWVKTVVYRNAWPHRPGKKDRDFLEQTIDYAVPSEKIADLKSFDSRLEVNAIEGRLSARSDSEAENFAELNLAEEIVSGKRTVDDARDFALRVEELSKSGKSSQYTSGLMYPSAVDDDGRAVP